MAILDARDLAKTFGPDRVLDGVSLAVEPGERIGLVGANGSGKSTLGRLLAGIEPPDAGIVAVQRGARIAYLAQTPELDPARSALDEALGGLVEWTAARARFERAVAAGAAASEAELARAQAGLEHAGGWNPSYRAEKILARLAITDPTTAVAQLSGGQRRRVALARTLVAEPDLAILDEPTNHLDVEAIEWLEAYLADGFRGAVVLITHDRALLDAVADRTCELEAGRLFAYTGGWEAYLEGKAERLAFEARVEANRQNFLRRELEWLRRQPKARTTKSRSRAERAEAALGAAPRPRAAAVDLSLDPARSGRRIVELDALRIVRGGRVLVDRLDLTILAGERLGILGPNGCGKTTLLDTIRGARAADGGHVRLGATAAVAYLSQDRDDLDDGKSVLENVTDDGATVSVAGRRIEARSYLARFGIGPAQARQPVGSLSGGERARVALARLLQRGANLLILDEPTNDLDVDTLGALEELLVESRGTALVVTHDRRFLDRVATGVLAFEGDGKVVRHAGGYSEWRAREAGGSASRRPSPAPRVESSADRPPPRRKGLSYRERVELERLVDEVEAAEERVAALEAALADPALYRRGGPEVARTVADLAAAKAEVARRTARWEELAMRHEETASRAD